MIKIPFSTMIELLGVEVEKEVNVDFNEVFQRMTLDAIGIGNLKCSMHCNVVLSLLLTSLSVLYQFICRKMCSCNECELPERQRGQVSLLKNWSKPIRWEWLQVTADGKVSEDGSSLTGSADWHHGHRSVMLSSRWTGLDDEHASIKTDMQTCTYKHKDRHADM